MFSKVLVGVDGHDGGRDAVALAARLLAPDGELTLAHVYPFPAAPAVRGYDIDGSTKILRSRDLLERLSQEAGIDAKLRWTAARSPGRGLHELAVTLTADLLVVGSTRRGLLGRVLLGDDTREALKAPPCALAIAPAGYAQRTAPIRTIGVGYDASLDSDRAVRMVRALAAEFDATLAGLEVIRRHGHAAEGLAEWSDSLDLLVVESRDGGPFGRLVHGGASQELARRAHCPLLVLTGTPRWVIPSDGDPGKLELAAAHRGSAER